MKTYGDIEWEETDVIETDVDGHGTKVVSLIGWARCDEGGGHFEFEATAIHTYPYEDEYEEIRIDEEATQFVPDEKDN